MMWLHGAANFGILLGATGLALVRSFRRPSVATAAIGLGACCAVIGSIPAIEGATYFGHWTIYLHFLSTTSEWEGPLW